MIFMDWSECGSARRNWPRLETKLKATVFISIVAVAVLLASCSDYPGTLWKPSIQYTVGGAVSGLTGTGLVLQDNGGNNLVVGAGATSFKFTAALASGSGYSVTVLSQPSSPTQDCAVTSGGNGVVANADITSVQVNCTTNSYTIGGTISGFTGTGLVLQDNNGNDLPVGAGATSFTFTTAVARGEAIEFRCYRNLPILRRPAE